MNFHRVSWLTALCVYVLPSLGYADVANAAATAPVERLRQIPEDAYKGVMQPAQGRWIEINKKMMRLAPGATIRDMNNRMVLPNTVRKPEKIRYTLDMYGQVKRIWISPTGGPVDRDQFVEPAEPNN